MPASSLSQRFHGHRILDSRGRMSLEVFLAATVGTLFCSNGAAFVSVQATQYGCLSDDEEEKPFTLRWKLNTVSATEIMSPIENQIMYACTYVICVSVIMYVDMRVQGDH